MLVPTIGFLAFDREQVFSDINNDFMDTLWRQKYLGLASDDSDLSKAIIKRILKLIENVTMRTTLSLRGSKNFDGLGASRVAEALANFLK
jgi:hypothetical protein